MVCEGDNSEKFEEKEDHTPVKERNRDDTPSDGTAGFSPNSPTLAFSVECWIGSFNDESPDCAVSVIFKTAMIPESNSLRDAGVSAPGGLQGPARVSKS